MRVGGGGAVGHRVGSAARFAGRCGEKERPRAVEKKRGKGRHGWAASGPSAGRKEKLGSGLIPGVGPKWKKMNFSKSNHFPNLFPLFSILSQIQIEFEFNFESTSPTFNQK